MSLSLLGGYSSPEEDESKEDFKFHNSSDDEGDQIYHDSSAPRSYKSVVDHSVASSRSDLPSALDAFSEISGPPEFLNNCVEDHASSIDGKGKHGRRKISREKKDLPTGAVVEAKPQLVGVHERVRSDIESNQHATLSVPTMTNGVKRAPTATNPNAEDAAELLRMCLHCRVPKTYTSVRGMVCPLCNDRPLAPLDETSKDLKKKGSAIKDKEKSKRMKGQSSHATWKSETEMHLRQQFD
ncbi:hypothetical protein HS088_TW17G00862 [Tripterygium wilfordii]|uniref:Uncharacterized protein n=1 Tax=Tripterygium wilfordii TaxID=458696 RepID=A0A7J7CGZ2_TRIWF|nr:uncharacterized protein LOC119983065 [Tripterygium wilfordii]KAF5733320.1 hypothetical protein HS088_TW17G00862 [Tripterygium wilfordii]